MSYHYLQAVQIPQPILRIRNLFEGTWSKTACMHFILERQQDPAMLLAGSKVYGWLLAFSDCSVHQVGEGADRSERQGDDQVGPEG